MGIKNFFKKFWESHVGESDEAFASKMRGERSLPRWFAFIIILIAAGGFVLCCLSLESISCDATGSSDMALLGSFCAMLVCVYYLVFGTIKTAVGNGSVKYLILVICACLLLPLYYYISVIVVSSIEKPEYIVTILFSYVPLVASVVIRELIRNGNVDEAFFPYVLLFSVQVVIMLPMNFVGGQTSFNTVFVIVSSVIMLGYLIYINIGKPKWLVIASAVLSLWVAGAFISYFALVLDSMLLSVIVFGLAILGFAIELRVSESY